MTTPLAVAPPTTYRNERAYPFCPGCGHGPVLDHLDRALTSLGRDPAQVVIVSDIGCSGLSDQYFVTSAFHGLHGRSVTYATGIKLARPDLTVVVIMGDGGTGIGGNHLLAAARRNIGITVLVMNNFNFGMTGGQHSATTPTGAATSTTPHGNPERPLDICATLAAAGADFVHRGTSFDTDLADRIAAGIASGGFAVLDVWELCTAHFAPANRAGRGSLVTLMARMGMRTGTLHRSDEDRAEFAAAYREACEPDRGTPLSVPRALAPRFASGLRAPLRVVFAGSAGGKVRSAARLVAEAAVLSGLFVAERDDYPVTVKTGHCVAEMVLSPEEIHHPAVDCPDAVVLLSLDGIGKAGRHLASLVPGGRIFALPGLPLPPRAGPGTRTTVTVLDPATVRPPLRPGSVALFAAAAALLELGAVSAEALELAVTGHAGPHERENLAAARAAASTRSCTSP